MSLWHLSFLLLFTVLSVFARPANPGSIDFEDNVLDRRWNSASHCGKNECQSFAHGYSWCSDYNTCSYGCDSGWKLHSSQGKYSCVKPVNTKTDINNCGAVGHRCFAPSGGWATCDDGKCSKTCPSGKHLSGDQCVTKSPRNTPNHCGPQGVKCPAPQGGWATCSNGHCGASCPSGYVLNRHKCVKSGESPTDCGPKGLYCPEPYGPGHATCVNGKCGILCPKGTSLHYRHGVTVCKK